MSRRNQRNNVRGQVATTELPVHTDSEDDYSLPEQEYHNIEEITNLVQVNNLERRENNTQTIKNPYKKLTRISIENINICDNLSNIDQNVINTNQSVSSELDNNNCTHLNELNISQQNETKNNDAFGDPLISKESNLTRIFFRILIVCNPRI
jgi:hypothetical protein